MHFRRPSAELTKEEVKELDELVVSLTSGSITGQSMKPTEANIKKCEKALKLLQAKSVKSKTDDLQIKKLSTTIKTLHEIIDRQSGHDKRAGAKK
jgi:hypothetical protein